MVQILTAYVHSQRRNIYAARNMYARAEKFQAEHLATLANMFLGNVSASEYVPPDFRAGIYPL